MTFYDIKGLVERDKATKPQAGTYDTTAIELSQFYEDRAQNIVLAYLKALGIGDRMNPAHLSASALRRIVSDQSVVYSTPPVRLLEVAGVELEDDDPEMKNLNEVFERMIYNAHWQQIDELRNLYRNVAVVLQESDAHGCVQIRTFEPFNVIRHVDPRAADIMDADQAVAFQISSGREDSRNVYELWLHEDDGNWRMHIVDGTGARTGVQPFGDDGASPFGSVAPFFMAYDEVPRGRAWLPINSNRLAFCKNASGLINDLVYLVKQEAHSSVAISTDDQRGLPTENGPGRVWVTPADSSIQVLSPNPKIAESAGLLDRVLRMWSNSESLPPDTFQADRQILTGQALKVLNMPLSERRRRQVPLVAPLEARAYQKLVAVHNAYHEQWGLPRLLEDAELRVTASDTWQPTDPKELQETVFKDLAIGAQSIIGYLMERYGLTRPEAVRKYERVQRDREVFPVMSAQNPLAIVDGGPHVATGPNGAQKNVDAFNPEIETSTEGASITDAVRVALDSDADPGGLN